MGVEGGTGGVGIAANVGSISALSELGSVMGKADISSIISEGPMLPSLSLKDTMPYSININHLGNYELKPIVKPEVSPLVAPAFEVADVISEAETILAEARIKPKVTEVPAVFQKALVGEDLEPKPIASVSEAKPGQPKEELGILEPKSNYRERVFQSTTLMLMMAHTVLPLPAEIALLPAANPAVHQNIVPEAVSKPAVLTKLEPAQIQTAPSFMEIPEVEEEAEEVVAKTGELVKQNQDSETGVEKSENSSLMKIKLVEAQEISESRRTAIRGAIKRLTGTKIIGRLVAQLLSTDFFNSKSPIAGEGKDWTIDLTADSIASDPNEYKNEEEAERFLTKAVDKHIPVKVGEEGRQATVEDVIKVVRGEGKKVETLKPKIPAEIVVKRISRKKVELGRSGEPIKILEDKVDTATESTLEKLGLIEVFQKAA